MTWLAIFGMSVITFMNRYAFFTSVIRYQPGPRIRKLLTYSSFAILTSIWAPIVFHSNEQTVLTHAGWDYLIAGTVAAGMSIAKIRSIAVVLISTGLFFALRWLM